MGLPEAYREINLKKLLLLKRGKVRDIFDLGDRLLMVASDRVSAFDVVLPNAIPYKGKVLNTISAHWFIKTKGIIKNHLITDEVEEFDIDITEDEKEVLKGRSSLVRKGKMIEVECVVRGYLDGSAWRSYRETGRMFDIPLPGGMKQGDRLPEPLFTPTTKAKSGHDDPITFGEMQKMLGEELASYLRSKSIELYNMAHDEVFEKGLILADTKFEFTFIDGEVHLADEIFTPDSSRYWDRESYKPGGPQPSFDKQYIRDWLELQKWDKTPPAPNLPEEVVRKSMELYFEACRRITGRDII